MLPAVLALCHQPVVPRAQKPEVLRGVVSALPVGHDMIYLQVPARVASLPVSAHKSAPAAVSVVDIVSYLTRDVPGMY